MFDEPEAGIDLWSFNNLIDVFTDIRKNIQGSVVIISHQERILAVADEIVVIAGGKVENRGAGKDLLPELMKAAWAARAAPRATPSTEVRTMDDITKDLLSEVSDYKDGYKGAYNIRENGCCVGRQSTDNIKIVGLPNNAGMEIRVAPGTRASACPYPPASRTATSTTRSSTTSISARARTSSSSRGAACIP